MKAKIGILCLTLILLLIGANQMTAQNTVLGTANYSKSNGLGFGLGYERDLGNRLKFATFGYSNFHSVSEVSTGLKYRAFSLGRLSVLGGARFNYITTDFSDQGNEKASGAGVTFNPQLEGRFRIHNNLDLIYTHNFKRYTAGDPDGYNYAPNKGVFSLGYRF